MFTDNASGKERKRPLLDKLPRLAHTEDTVLGHSKYRPIRNFKGSASVVLNLIGLGVRIEFTKESLVNSGDDSPLANFMPAAWGAFADFERTPHVDPQREGVAQFSSFWVS